MRRIVLAALLAAVALPAWATNDDTTIQSDWNAKTNVCAALEHTTFSVCYLHHAPNDWKATEYAQGMLAYCKARQTGDLSSHLLTHADRSSIRMSMGQADPVADKNCEETLAYIKQRWGY